MNIGAWFLIAAWLAGAICAVVGMVRALRIATRVKTHANALVPQTLIAKAAAAEEAAEHLQSALALIEALLLRMVVALEQSALALRELRGAFSLRR